MERGTSAGSKRFQRDSSATVRRPGRLQAFLVRRATLIRGASMVLILIAVLLLVRTLPTERVLHSAQAWIDSLGWWGPLALGLIYVVAVVLLFPASLLTLVAGALYGLIVGTIIASLASTTGAALAFLVARYVARDRVRRRVERSPKLAAVDKAIGEQGWKIVALLRLSPAVPFNLQNYLYGVTSIRFWPYVLTSWVAMLPGTFLYVYLGSLGKTAATGGETSTAEWIVRGVGLFATVAVTVYIARLARNAIHSRTHIEDEPEHDGHTAPDDPAEQASWPWSTLIAAAVAVAILVLALWATARKDAFRSSVEQLLGLPPSGQPMQVSAAPVGPGRSSVG